MSDKKKSGFLFFLAGLLIVAGLLTAAYFAGSFPSFNRAVDTAVQKITFLVTKKSVEKKDAANSAEASESVAETEDNPSVTDYEELSEESEESNSIIEEIISEPVSAAKIPDKALILAENPVLYSLTDESAEKIYRNTGADLQNVKDAISMDFYNGYAILTPVVEFADADAFITSEPRLVVRNRKDNSVSFEQWDINYPLGRACAWENAFVFAGRDGKNYAFVFGDNLPQGEFAAETQKSPMSCEENLFSAFTASDKFYGSLRNELYLLGINAFSSGEFPETGFFLPPDEDNNFATGYFSIDRTSVFVFSPMEQGLHTISLVDEKGAVVKERTFVAVFSENGERLSMSLGYLDDRPVTSLHLDDSIFYYIVSGAFDGAEIPEESKGRIVVRHGK
ncbi:MAG: hypothetical protein MJ183_00315 [Treponemataceae bacterium]|nr:hypothetical protein [Treponemataceae bacterium]